MITKTKYVSLYIVLLMMHSVAVRAEFFHTDFTLEGFKKVVTNNETSIQVKNSRLQAQAHLRGIYFGYRSERLSSHGDICVLPESINTEALVTELFESSENDAETFYPKMSLTQALRYVLFRKCNAVKKPNNTH